MTKSLSQEDLVKKAFPRRLGKNCSFSLSTLKVTIDIGIAWRKSHPLKKECGRKGDISKCSWELFPLKME